VELRLVSAQTRGVDVTDPPLDGVRVHADEAQEVAVPDRPGRRVAVHAVALVGEERTRAFRQPATPGGQR
jgi:hypothetical protein